MFVLAVLNIHNNNIGTKKANGESPKTFKFFNPKNGKSRRECELQIYIKLIIKTDCCIDSKVLKNNQLILFLKKTNSPFPK